MNEDDVEKPEPSFAALVDLMGRYRDTLSRVTRDARVCVIMTDKATAEMETGTETRRRPGTPKFSESDIFLSSRQDALSGHEQIGMTDMEREILALATSLSGPLQGKIDYLKINLVGDERFLSILRENGGNEKLDSSVAALEQRLRFLAGA